MEMNKLFPFNQSVKVSESGRQRWSRLRVMMALLSPLPLALA